MRTLIFQQAAIQLARQAVIRCTGGLELSGLLPGSFLHLFQRLLDSPTTRFGQATDAVGLLPPGLNLNAIPEPSRVVMITCDLFPRDVFIRMTEPKESPSLNDDLFR